MSIVKMFPMKREGQNTSQIPRSKLTGQQSCSAAKLRGIRPSRHSPNARASTALGSLLARIKMDASNKWRIHASTKDIGTIEKKLTLFQHFFNILTGV